MKRDIYDLPDSLYEFAQFSDFRATIEDLALLVEDEDWNYHQTEASSDYDNSEMQVPLSCGNAWTKVI